MAEKKSLRAIGRQVVEDLSELVGFHTEGISGIRRNDNGYIVTVEVLELRRVPETSDVLATYEVHTDEEGEITEYDRKRRYTRAQTQN
jgi:hypothetical protein